jgi:hypothetical protein
LVIEVTRCADGGVRIVFARGDRAVATKIMPDLVGHPGAWGFLMERAAMTFREHAGA